MSDTVLVGLITGGVGVAGLLVNVWNQGQERRSRVQMEQMRQEEQYRFGLYQKRLEVHQRAYEYIFQLNVALNRAKPGESAQENRELLDLARQAREWLDSVALYMDSDSRYELVYFLNLCFAYPRGQPPPGVNIWRQMGVSERAIVSGIGMKHIDERKVTDVDA